MKFTIAFVGLLTITSTLALKEKENVDPKGKRQTSEGYGSPPRYQLHSPSHSDGNSLSIGGAGYSSDASKSLFQYKGHQGPSFNIPKDISHGQGHQTVKLAPITLQPSQGSFIGSDLTQLMNQLSHGLSTGALSLEPAAGGGYQIAGQDHSLPQYTFGAPNQYGDTTNAASVPQYAAEAAKGLSAYGSTGPVLFNPSDPQQAPQGISYSPPASLSGNALPSFTHPNPHSLSFGGAGNSYGGVGSLSGHSLGGISLSHGPSIGSLAGYSGYGKLHAFKPSAYVGSSFGDSGNVAAFSTPPGVGHSLPVLHRGFSLGPSGLNFGSLSGYGSSAKHTYQPVKSEAPLPSLSAASSAGIHGHGSPATHYSINSSGSPSSTYSVSNNAPASSSPQYYVASSKGATSASFGEGSVYKSAAPSSGLSAYGHAPKYSFGGFSRFAPKDAQGSYSDTVYNTIKYSEELKPRSYMH